MRALQVTTKHRYNVKVDTIQSLRLKKNRGTRMWGSQGWREAEKRAATAWVGLEGA